MRGEMDARRWLEEILQPLRTPLEISPSGVEEYLIEAEGHRGGIRYLVLRSKDSGEYIFWASEQRGLEDLWKAPRYSDYAAMVRGVQELYRVAWNYAG